MYHFQRSWRAIFKWNLVNWIGIKGQSESKSFIKLFRFYYYSGALFIYIKFCNIERTELFHWKKPLPVVHKICSPPHFYSLRECKWINKEKYSPLYNKCQCLTRRESFWLYMPYLLFFISNCCCLFRRIRGVRQARCW